MQTLELAEEWKCAEKLDCNISLARNYLAIAHQLLAALESAVEQEPDPDRKFRLRFSVADCAALIANINDYIFQRKRAERPLIQSAMLQAPHATFH